MAPTLHDVAGQLDDIVDIVKVNIEETRDNQALAGEYGVQSIPNMPIFQDGKEVDRIIGLISKVQLTEMLAKLAK